MMWTLITTVGAFALAEAAPARYDVVVIGSTPGGVMAAVAAARTLDAGPDGPGARRPHVNRVALLSEGSHVGGVSSSGLGQSDVGGCTDGCIGGLALEFFQRNAATYTQPQPRAPWNLEPHVAEGVFRAMLDEAGVDLIEHTRVVAAASTASNANALASVTTADGRVFAASVFADATYAGDLLPLANLSYAVGREGIAQYNESLAGVRGVAKGHEFDVAVDPFVRAGSAGGPLLPHVGRVAPPAGAPGSKLGEADARVQSYNFRLCVSNTPGRFVPWPKPPGYDPAHWELARRLYAARNASDPKHTNRGWWASPTGNTQPVPSSVPGYDKYDANNDGAISTDVIGLSDAYPEANHSTRAALWTAHQRYTMGLMYFLANDPGVPARKRASMRAWGLCGDEFNSTDHWPPQLYIREGRRMVGDAVFTQHTAEGQKKGGGVAIGNASIGLGAYNFDAHNAQRYACVPGHSAPALCPPHAAAAWGQPPAFAWNGGDVETNPGVHYAIPASVLLPRAGEGAGANLVVPVAVSASHIGYATLRMEPQFMIMGHSAGALASIAARNGTAVQDVDAAALQEMLDKDGQKVRPPQ